ncbi:MAG: outer membrane lipoprotein carrier protein LolA [Planctomycetota bacterium]
MTPRRAARRSLAAPYRLCAGLALSLAFVVPAAPGGPAAPPAASPDPWAPLENLAQGRDPVRTYAADFTQEKSTPVLRDPLVSHGQVRVTPGLSRWDTDRPYPSTMLIAPGELRLHYPDQNVLEIYPLGQRLDALAASPVPDLAVLREHFTLASLETRQDPDALTATLLPRSEEVAQALEQVVVEIDPQRGTLRRLRLTDLDGETTTLTFQNVRLNPPLDPDDLALAVPDGTRVLYPLEADAR